MWVHSSIWICLGGRWTRNQNPGGEPGGRFCRRNWNEAGAPFPPLSSPWFNLKVRQIMWFQLRLASFNLKVKISLQRRETCMNWNWNKLTQSPVNWNCRISHSSLFIFLFSHPPPHPKLYSFREQVRFRCFSNCQAQKTIYTPNLYSVVIMAKSDKKLCLVYAPSVLT